MKTEWTKTIESRIAKYSNGDMDPILQALITRYVNICVRQGEDCDLSDALLKDIDCYALAMDPNDPLMTIREVSDPLHVLSHLMEGSIPYLHVDDEIAVRKSDVLAVSDVRSLTYNIEWPHSNLLKINTRK